MKIEEAIKTTAVLSIEKKVLLNIIYTQNIINDKLNDALKSYELSNEQYNVLRILRGQNGNPANMCVIQERMLAKNSNTTRLIDKLLLKELVSRTVCPQNRRKMEILITPKGINILDELEPKITQTENSFASNLTKKELEQLNNLIEKYRETNN